MIRCMRRARDTLQLHSSFLNWPADSDAQMSICSPFLVFSPSRTWNGRRRWTSSRRRIVDYSGTKIAIEPCTVHASLNERKCCCDWRECVTPSGDRSRGTRVSRNLIINSKWCLRANHYYRRQRCVLLYFTRNFALFTMWLIYRSTRFDISYRRIFLNVCTNRFQMHVHGREQNGWLLFPMSFRIDQILFVDRRRRKIMKRRRLC